MNEQDIHVGVGEMAELLRDPNFVPNGIRFRTEEKDGVIYPVADWTGVDHGMAISGTYYPGGIDQWHDDGGK